MRLPRHQATMKDTTAIHLANRRVATVTILVAFTRYTSHSQRTIVPSSLQVTQEAAGKTNRIWVVQYIEATFHSRVQAIQSPKRHRITVVRAISSLLVVHTLWAPWACAMEQVWLIRCHHQRRLRAVTYFNRWWASIHLSRPQHPRNC